MVLYQFGKCYQVDAIRISAGPSFLQYTLNISINNFNNKVQGILIKFATSGTTLIKLANIPRDQKIQNYLHRLKIWDTNNRTLFNKGKVKAFHLGNG